MSKNSHTRVPISLYLPFDLFEKLGKAEGLAKLLASAADGDTRGINIHSASMDRELSFQPFCGVKLVKE